MAIPMNRTELSIRKMLAAIEAPLYDVGVLSDRGMLPGLDGISAEAVLAKLSLLKYRNARGSHIYIRPSGEHRFTVLDDLSETSLAKLSADGFDPCAVVETSVGNFQAWLKHSAVLPKLVGSLAAQLLARRYDADLSAAGWRRFGRLPGFTNCKPKYRKPDGLFPFVRLISHTGLQYPMAEAFHEEITKLYEDEDAKARGALAAGFSFSPEGREVRVSGAVPYLDQIRGSTGCGGHRLLCCGFRQWHDRRPDRACPRRRLSLPRSQSFNTSCLHSENHGKGERLGKC